MNTSRLISHKCIHFLMCLCVLFCSFSPLQADICDDCCDPCQSSWLTNWGISRSMLLLGGGVVLGGLAGAIAGGMCSQNHHHSDSSSDCESGPFIIDPSSSNVIVFQMGVEPASFISLDTVNIRPFVELPDGRVFKGEIVNFTGTAANQLYYFPGINVENPLFGTYHFGLEISDASFGPSNSVKAIPSVVTSRQGTTTHLEIMVIDATSFSIVNGVNLQVTWEFTYSKNNIP